MAKSLPDIVVICNTDLTNVFIFDSSYLSTSFVFALARCSRKPDYLISSIQNQGFTGFCAAQAHDPLPRIYQYKLLSCVAGLLINSSC